MLITFIKYLIIRHIYTFRCFPGFSQSALQGIAARLKVMLLTKRIEVLSPPLKGEPALTDCIGGLTRSVLISMGTFMEYKKTGGKCKFYPNIK
jgi:hypothetical protein